MATIKNCVCAVPWGQLACDNIIGIAELYWCHYKQIIDIVYAATANGCCDKGEILSFGMDISAPILPEELLQPVEFVKQDDNTGANVEWTWSDEGGNKSANYTATIQVPGSNPDQDCSIYGAVGQEICLVFKGKDGYWRILNYDGGAKLQSSDGSINQSYSVVVLTGRVNSRQLFVSYTDGNAWADTALIPNSLDPSAGLINA